MKLVENLQTSDKVIGSADHYYIQMKVGNTGWLQNRTQSIFTSVGVNSEENQKAIAEEFEKTVLNGDEDYLSFVEFIKKQFPTDRRFKRKKVIKYIKKINKLISEGKD